MTTFVVKADPTLFSTDFAESMACTNLALARGTRGAAQIGEQIDSLVLDLIGLPGFSAGGRKHRGGLRVRVEHEVLEHGLADEVLLLV